MPQTVAMQRGTVSGSASGGWITLFTQSGGIATRVIPVNFTHWFSQSANNNTAYFQLAIASSTGGGQIISSMNSTSSGNMNSFQITCTTNNAQDIVSVGTTAASKSIRWIGGGAGASPYNASISAVQNQYGSTGQSANAIGQFFMGPGDSLQYRVTGVFNQGKGTATCTSNAHYSFVTVTES
jgi:hypothetical protein